MPDQFARWSSRHRLGVLAGAGAFLDRGVVEQQVPVRQVPAHGHMH